MRAAAQETIKLIKDMDSNDDAISEIEDPIEQHELNAEDFGAKANHVKAFPSFAGNDLEEKITPLADKRLKTPLN